MQCVNFELEYELLLISLKKLTLYEGPLEQKCEVHNFGGQAANLNLSSSPVPCTDVMENQIGNHDISVNTFNVPEFWEISYTIHPNLEGLEYPTTVEVVIHKNGNQYCNEWFENRTTKNITNIGLIAISECCSNIITDFREHDIINFYLTRTAISSLSKTRIKSKSVKAFIDILVYLASVTLQKCNVLCSKNFEPVPAGQPPTIKKILVVNPSAKEIKGTINDHIFKRWVKKFNSANRYHQTKLFITEPSDSISRELLALPRLEAKNIVSFLTGFGPFKRHLMKIDPKTHQYGECRACKEGGSLESPEHLIYECEDLQWDREFIFGHKWPILGDPPVCSTNCITRPAAASLQAGQHVRPANSALAGQVRRVSNRSYTSFPSSSWTIDQIREFVSVDSLSEIFVQYHIPMGETEVLNSTTDSADVHFALH